jgi:cell division protein FtsB
VLGQVVKLESFNTYKEWVDGELATLQDDLAKAATKEEVEALQTLLQDSITTVKNDLGFKISNLEAILEVVDGESEVIADIYSQLDDQLAAIQKNKADIEATTDDLQAKYDELNAAIDALKGRVTNLEDGLADLNDRVDQIKGETDDAIKALAKKLDSQVNLILNLIDNLDKSVKSLTFIPDYDLESRVPIIPVHLLGEWYKPEAEVENWDPNLSDEKDLTPYKGITYVRYHVHPSNATLDDFEVVGLLQQTTEILRSSTEEPLLKAVTEDVTLNNGILTVPILVHEDLYNMEDFESNVSFRSSASPDDDNERMFLPTVDYDKNIKIALKVKNKKMEAEDGEKRYVVSSYENTRISLLFSRIELIDKEGDLGIWQNVLPSHMSDDIALDTYYKPSASIKLWNGYDRTARTYDKDYSINLNDSLQAIAKFNDNWRLLEEFGYDNIEDHFVFELIDVENEGVNQSSYVTLNGATGVIKVKAGSNGNPNQAAVGRTPIVLVKVVKNGKVYAAGYLKIEIIEKVDNSPIEFGFTLEDYTLDCNSQYQLTDIDLQNIDFDQIFDHERVMLGKDAFFTAYRQNPIVTEVVSAPVLATGNEISFVWNVDDPTQGGNLANYINGTIANTAPAGKYVVKTTLTGEGTQPDIIITWTVTVKLPTITLNANTSILANGKIIVNPTILEQDGKTSTAYEALLNNAFMHQADEFIYTGLTEDCEEYLTPYFVFTAAPAGYVIADNGTTLRQGTISGPLAARIDQDGLKYYVRLNQNVAPNPDSWGNYPPLSEAAKGLVGKTVSVQPKAYINNADWNVINLYNAFNVEFTYPLELNLPQNAVVYDQANNGMNSYSLDVFNPETILVDWFGSELNVTTAAGRALYDHYEVGVPPVDGTVITGYTYAGSWPTFGAVTRPGYMGYWYPNTTPTQTYSSPFDFDLDNIKCNINTEGQIVEAITYPIPAGMELKFNAVEAAGSTTWVVGGTTVITPSVFTFQWNNGATGAIQNEFKIAVPVTVNHKWGTLTENLVITVKPGAGPTE